MIPAKFDYVAPTSVEDALAALSQHGDDAKIIAGGQSLLPVLRMRLNAPEMVIDLGRIDSLRGVRDEGDSIVIGAMTTHHDVRDSDLVQEHALLLSRAAAEVADPQIRHRGTFGGALAHADPAGDLGAPALALGAEFVIAGSGGTRTVAADDFFVDLFETAVGEDEILTEIRVPKHTGWGAHYEKFVRVAHQWPIVAVGAVIRGGTPHFEYVAGECVKGMAQVSLKYAVPIAFGVLTVDTIEQAIERAGTKAGNKGAEAAMSAIEMVTSGSMIGMRPWPRICLPISNC